jgi:hypothetical protein
LTGLLFAVNEVIGENRVAFNEACEYPDGTRVLAAMTLDDIGLSKRLALTLTH